MGDPFSPSLKPRPAFAAAASAGLAGGLLDCVYASARGVGDGGSAAGVWRSVASGWLGPAAHEAGLYATMLGLATHFAIAIAMAAAWVLADLRLRLAGPMRYAVAALYGVGLYALMNLIVLPLRWPSMFPRWQSWGSVLDVAAHVAMAIMIAWVSARALARPAARSRDQARCEEAAALFAARPSGSRRPGRPDLSPRTRGPRL